MSEKKRNLIGLVTGGIAACLIIMGIINGEPVTVLHNAVDICLECIGIG